MKERGDTYQVRLYIKKKNFRLLQGGLDMKNKKFIILLSLVFALSFILAACGGGETTDTGNTGTEKEKEEEVATGPTPGGDIIVGSIGAPTNFNPLYSTDTASSSIGGLIFDGLVSSDPSLAPEPALAESWTSSEDGLTWNFKLKEGLKFTDGTPLTANDVKFTYSIPLNEEYDGTRASSFEMIEEINVIDDLNIEFKLNKVDAGFIWTASYGILPSHLLKDVPVKDLKNHEFNTKAPVGTGPYTFVEWVEGQYVKVTKNESYHGGAPYINTITFKIVPDQNSILAQLQTGEVNFATVPATDYPTVEQWAKDGTIAIQSAEALNYTYLGYNLANPLFEDKSVRQALTHALDREAIVAAVLNGRGTVANAPQSPVSWAYDDSKVPVFEFNVEKAKQLLADAGWADTDGDGILDKDGKKFEFVIKTNQGNKARETIAQIVQQQFKEVGIAATPQIIEWSAFINDSLLAKKYDAVILGWSLGVDPDPSGIFHTKEIAEGFNTFGYSRPDLDKLMDEQLLELDREKRKGMIATIDSQIAEDQPYSFLYYPTNDTAVPVNLKDRVLHPSGDFYKVEKWYFEQK
jgi:peptide/nickel transport system substrate-binding protein